MNRFVAAVFFLLATACGGTTSAPAASSQTPFPPGKVEMRVDWSASGSKAYQCLVRFTAIVGASNPDQYTTTIFLGGKQLVKEDNGGGSVSTDYLEVSTSGLQGVRITVTYLNYTWDRTFSYTCPTDSAAGDKVLATPSPTSHA